MTQVRIIVTEAEHVLADLLFDSNSKKRLTAPGAARLLAKAMPGFKRRKGRLSLSAGMETLPALEESGKAWLAWRLRTEDDSPSGFEPSLTGHTGNAESDGNPFSDRTRGVWQRAEISTG